MNRNQKEKKRRGYVTPATRLFRMQSESNLLRASFNGGHASGQTGDSGTNQGGGHGGGSVGGDTGDAKRWNLWDDDDSNYDD